MEIYNIKVVNVDKNEYNGTIIIENNKIRGLGTEKNYDTLCIIKGEGDENKLHLKIRFETGMEYIFDAYKTDISLKKSIAPSENYHGTIISYCDGDPVNGAKDNLFVTLTNIKNIEKEIKNKVLTK
jgi:hypothetical protein